MAVLRFILLVLVGGVALAWIHAEDRRRQRERDERERQRMLLYEMTVDEAQAIVWGWEEMTEDERAALPLERRVEIRKIREDLAAHKKKWGLR